MTLACLAVALLGSVLVPGDEIEVVRKGNGPEILSGYAVTLDYTLQAIPPGQVEAQGPWKIRETIIVGERFVVPGLRDALVGCTFGTEFRMSIPAESGFRRIGSPFGVPPGSELRLEGQAMIPTEEEQLEATRWPSVNGPPPGYLSSRFLSLAAMRSSFAAGRVEAALNIGLDRLAELQHEDGFWEAEGPYARDGITSMAVVCLLASGENLARNHSPQRSGLKWLMDRTAPDSEFANLPCLDQTLVVLALQEGFIMREVSRIGVGDLLRPVVASIENVPCLDTASTSELPELVFWRSTTDLLSLRLAKDEREIRKGVVILRDRWPEHIDASAVRSRMGLSNALLFRRLVLGEADRSWPALADHADLSSFHLGSFTMESLHSSPFLWINGLYSAYQLGAPYWQAWEAAVIGPLLDTIEQEALDGASAGPAGLLRTLHRLLILEVYTRFDLILGDG